MLFPILILRLSILEYIITGVDDTLLKRDEFKFILNDVYQKIAEKGFSTDDMKDYAYGTYINMYPEVIQCGVASPTGKCYGVTYYNEWAIGQGISISVWMHTECLGQTALIHELMHWARAVIYFGEIDIGDSGHQYEMFFGKDSLEEVLKVDATQQFCSER